MGGNKEKGQNLGVLSLNDSNGLSGFRLEPKLRVLPEKVLMI